jgi:hypothetical protein
MAYVKETRAREPQPTRALVQQIHERFGVTIHPRSLERALGREEKKRS